jgi:hypothetical protein
VENSSFEEQIHSRLRELTDELRRIRRELSDEIKHRPSHTPAPVPGNDVTSSAEPPAPPAQRIKS